MAAIKAIDKAAVHRICSGQVIVELQTAVKELVENSLDAGAKFVEVRLKDYGGTSIEVIDNGRGVSPSNFAGLTAKYHTSKIAKFNDIWSVQSFGFRGEALSSLCEVSGSFEVCTRTASEPVGSVLQYDNAGRIKSKVPRARPVGTTITVKELFKPLPVRRREFLKSVKRQYSKLLLALQAYAMISVGVRITCSNQNTKTKSRSRLLSTQANATVGDNIANVFGTKFFATLQPLHIDLEQEDDEGATNQPPPASSSASSSASQSADTATASNARQCVEGFVSKAGTGVARSNNDKQFLFINGRPVSVPKVSKALNEVWRQFEMKHKPAYVLNLNLKHGTYDVNVTPDKREVFLTQERTMVRAIKEGLNALWAPSRYTFDVEQLQPTLPFAAAPKKPASRRQFSVGGSAGGGGAVDHGSPREAPHSQHEASTASETAKAMDASDMEAESLPSSLSQPVDHAMGVSELLASASSVSQSGVSQQSQPSDHSIAAGGGGAGGGAGVTAAPAAAAPAAMTAAAASVFSRTFASRVTASRTKRARNHHRASQLAEPSPHHDDAGEDGGEGDFEMNSAKLRRTPKRQRRALQLVHAVAAHRERAAADVALEDANEEDNEEEAELGDETMPTTASHNEEAEEEDEQQEVHEEELAEEALAEADTDDDEGQEEQGEAEGVGGESPETELEEEDMEEEQEAGVEVEEAGLGSPPIGSSEEPGTALTESSGATARVAGSVSCAVDTIQATMAAWARRDGTSTSTANGCGVSTRASVTACVTGDKGMRDVEEALTRSLTKSTFRKMQVLGQFNMGFIVARTGADLFILDQHACDEKVNFERLQQTTTIHQQPLIAPMPVEVTAAEEVIIMDNLDIFERNGFHFTVDDSQPATRKLKVTALPYSKSVQFGAEDIHELASLLRETPGQMVRLPKAMAMFASRACRSAVMVGDPLDRRTMKRVVHGMAELDQPWNCPHGRPTMRHLVDLNQIRLLTKKEKPKEV